uniref:cation-dependent mannose-6-phosphate receptor-like n=1 Tax=Styela clava TaxID=7725 RepID=UPI0019393152|nr:cation-dependent mannose-6-phosphate receptor-like [Styela clava]
MKHYEMDALSNRKLLKVLFLLSFGYTLIVAECTLSAQKDSISSRHISSLDPLKDKIFTYNFKDEKDREVYKYTLSICSEIEPGTNIAVTQEDLVDHKTKTIGKIDQASIKRGSNWIMLTLKGGDPYHTHCGHSPRQAHVMIMCDKYHLARNFTVLYEENKEESESCFYLMELQSSVACSNVDQGLSTGSIVLIVFACVIAVYLAVGMLYKRCVHGKKGMEQVPNIGFWKTCGSLQADGCDWLCRCQESGFDSSRPYRGIADDQLDDDADDENLLPM